MNPIVEAGEAIVSPEGVHYLGKLYSLRQAIRLQWFDKARIEGSWSIPVYYDAALQQLCIRIDGQYISCSPISRRKLDQERIHIEIGLFGQLKERWLANKTGNNQKQKYFPGKRTNR